MALTDISLKWKIGIGFGAQLSIVAVLGIIAYVSVSQLDSTAKDVAAIEQKTLLATRIGLGMQAQSASVRGYLDTGREDLLPAGDQAKGQVADSLGQLDMSVVNPAAKKLLVDLHKNISDMQLLYKYAIEYRREKILDEANEMIFNESADDIRSQTDNNLTNFIAFEEKLREDALQRQSAIVGRVRAITVAFSVLGLLIGALAAVQIVRWLMNSILRMLSFINEVANNNLSVSNLAVTSFDEIGQAVDALNRMKESLGQAMSSISSSSHHLASASEEISAAAAEQASGADMQRNQTSQVASAMQEMSATVADISLHSTHAADLARKASETAKQGGKIVEQTLQKMGEISQSVADTAKKVEQLGNSSDEIGKIIGVIDDIADQTNLLALNAAIEAARAGEQGRGFAVVADEVRKLAERTSKATKEIAAMIQGIQGETRHAVEAMKAGTHQVEAGVERTAAAGKSLKEIINSAEKVGEMVGQIATAAAKQTRAAEEVNGSVEQIAKITSETAEGAQQSAKACHELSSVALDLQNIVDQFQLASEGRSARARSGSHVRGALALPASHAQPVSRRSYNDITTSENEHEEDSETILSR